MVDWNSEYVVQLTSLIFEDLQMIFLGVNTWHFLWTLHQVEWPLISGRMRFRLIYIPYFLGRYSLIISLLAPLIAPGTNNPSDTCIADLIFFTILGSVVLAASSTNLLLRAWALWQHSRFVRGILLSLSLTQWALGFGFGALHSGNSEGAGSALCGGKYLDNRRNFVIFFLYTVLFDASILVFTIIALHIKADAAGTRLWVKVFKHPIWYLLATMMANIPTVVFAWLDLNPIMNMIFALPSGSISVIISSAAVVSLIELEMGESEEAGDSDKACDIENIADRGPLTTHIDIAPASRTIQSRHFNGPCDDIGTTVIQPMQD